MGNCMGGDAATDAVRIMTDSGGIMELKGPVSVRTVLVDFPGYGLFRQGNVSSPLLEHDRLLNGRVYYLLPMRLSSSSSSSATASSDLLTVGPALQVLPSPGNGVWRVKLMIDTDQLAEILSEQANTQALIERMRTAASASCVTPKRGKGTTWSGGWNLCKAVEDLV